MSPYKIFLLIIWPYLINDFFIIYWALTQEKWVIIPDEILFAVVPLTTILILVKKKKITLKGLGWPGLSDIFEEEIFALVYFIFFHFVLLKGVDQNKDVCH